MEINHALTFEVLSMEKYPNIHASVLLLIWIRSLIFHIRKMGKKSSSLASVVPAW